MARKCLESNRPISACQRCRAAKVGCDKSKPQCKRCVRVGAHCTYSPGGGRPHEDNLTSIVRDAESHRAPKEQTHGTLSTSSSPGRPHVPARRDRAIISCVRCRKLKVRCDRGAPCGRCARLKKGSECTYLGDNSANSSSALTDRTKTIATTYVDRQWHQRFRTPTHWATLLNEIKGSLPACRKRESRPGSPTCPTPGLLSLSINFPFSSGSGNIEPAASIISRLPSKSVQRSLIALYMDTVESAHGFLDDEAFEAELGEFWSNEAAVADDWLAQYLLVLALGSLARVSVAQSEGDRMDTLPSRLLDAAEACLRRAPFMLRPTPAVIRTLCLAIIVKQIYSMSCHESDTCWPLVGMIVRLSIGMGLHVNRDRASRRLWANVVYLDMKQSLTCGMPLLLQSAHTSSLSMGNTSGELVPDSTDGGALERVLADSGDVLFRAIDLATRRDEAVTYEEVIEVESQIRHHLRRPETNPTESFQPPSSLPYFDLEACTADIFLRQILLALTSRFALHPSSSTLYPASHISSLESALAILSHQRALYEGEHGATAWFAGLFRFDFFTAAMTICCQLVRNDSALDMAVTESDGEVPRAIVVEALKGCRELWRSERGTSICNARAFGIIDEILRLLDQRGSVGSPLERAEACPCMAPYITT